MGCASSLLKTDAGAVAVQAAHHLSSTVRAVLGLQQLTFPLAPLALLLPRRGPLVCCCCCCCLPDLEQMYELDRQVGEGVEGAVYLATERASGQQVAIKLVHRWVVAVGSQRGLPGSCKGESTCHTSSNDCQRCQQRCQLQLPERVTAPCQQQRMLRASTLRQLVCLSARPGCSNSSPEARTWGWDLKRCGGRSSCRRG